MSIEVYQGKRGRSYQARVEKVDGDGRREQTSMTFKRRKDAEAYEAEWNLKKRTGGAALIEPNKITVSSLLTEWLEFKRGSLEPNTHAWYARAVKTHIVPALGDIPIQRLTSHQIEKFVAAKRDSYPSGKGARTTEVCYRVLSQALKYAVRHRWVERNEAALFSAPAARRRRRMTWTDEQLAQFLTVAEAEGYGPIFLLEASTGIRRGELLGLRWQDIDEAKRTITIVQTVGPDPSGITVVKPRTKTDAGERNIDIDDACVAALGVQRARQNQQRLRAGVAWQENDLVFSTDVGTPMNPPNLHRAYSRMVMKAGVPRISIHDMRHTHATQLLEEGVPIHVVSQRLGHKKTSTTMDIYAHVMPGQQRKAADAFGERLARARAAYVKKT